MMQLTGEIPGLLRRGSPCRWLRMTNDMREGVCYFAPLRPTVLLLCHDPCREPATPNPADVTLDLSDPTGRFHARLWLAERGHDVGSEDRAEVLAWSVLSVWRGGKPLRDVVGKARAGADAAQQAVEDAALLARGMALTNPDGTLTLPPLPGAK